MLGFDICNLLDKLIGKKVKVHQMSIEFLAILFRPFKAQIFIQYNKIRKQYLFFQILWFLTVYELQFEQKNICHLSFGTTLQMNAGIYGESTFRTCKNDRETLYRGKPQ